MTRGSNYVISLRRDDKSDPVCVWPVGHKKLTVGCVTTATSSFIVSIVFSKHINDELPNDDGLKSTNLPSSVAMHVHRYE